MRIDLLNIKQTNICIRGFPEEKEKVAKKKKKLTEKTIAENLPNQGQKNKNPGSGSTERSKQYEPKKVHTKTQ